MRCPRAIARLLNKYPSFPIKHIEQLLNEVDFDDQKRKQNEHLIEGAALGVITTYNNRVILTKRTKPHRGWALPGGRVEKGEDFDTALIREVKEECGVDIKITNLAVIEDKRFISPQLETLHFWLVVFRACTCSWDEVDQTEEATSEGLEVKTFSIDDLPINMILQDKEKVLAFFSN